MEQVTLTWLCTAHCAKDTFSLYTHSSSATLGSSSSDWLIILVAQRTQKLGLHGIKVLFNHTRCLPSFLFFTQNSLIKMPSNWIDATVLMSQHKTAVTPLLTHCRVIPILGYAINIMSRNMILLHTSLIERKTPQLIEAQWRIYAPAMEPSLVHIMACLLLSAKPLSEPMQEYC